MVAGGDGTVAEVVTGLLRREDEATVSSQWTLGIIPVGFTNSLAKVLYTDTEADVRYNIIENTMEPLYNEDLATMKITLLYLVSCQHSDQKKNQRAYLV